MKFVIKKSMYFLALGCLAISCSDEATNISQLENEIQVAPKQGEPAKFKNNNFYTAPSNTTSVNFTGTTSTQLNTLINRHDSASGNGVVIKIPRRNYTWTRINIKSNIHLEIAGGTTIKAGGAAPVFMMGGSGTGQRTKNVSIYGKGGAKYTVDISANTLTNKNVAVARIGRVDNFRVADMNIKDRRSSVNSIVLVHVGGAAERRPGPKNGVIENISQTGAHTGYGLVQTYSADNVLFKKLSCEGGITLRMETDDRIMKDDLKNGTKDAGIKNIFAYDIRNSNGLTAVMFSPHFVNNGKVTIQKVIANGSAFAVRIEKGFLELFDKNNTYPINNDGQRRFRTFVENQFNLPNGVTALSGNPYKRNNGRQWAVRLSAAAGNANRNAYVKDQLGTNLQIGKFATSNVSLVTANYQDDKGAKIKQGQLKYIPCNKWSRIDSPGASLGMFNGFEYHGPSVALSIDTTNGTINGDNYKVNIRNQRFNSFPSGFTQNIKPNTSQSCGNAPNTIRSVTARFP